MVDFGSLTFVTPWLLTALAALPALWWLLRLLPPAPRRIRFPAIRLLFGLEPREETPQRTPPWLVLLRLLLASLVIMALAHPLIDATGAGDRSGPLLVVVDNGWGAATRWPTRGEAMQDALERAQRAGRPVYVLTTAPQGGEAPDMLSGPRTAAQAMELARALQPLPWPTDRAGALRALKGVADGLMGDVLWLSDGIATEPAADRALADRLAALGPLKIMRDPPSRLALLNHAPSRGGNTLTVTVSRATAQGARTAMVRASEGNGRLVTLTDVTFATGERIAEKAIDLPPELINRIERIGIEGEESAGATVLLDERWRRRPVGLVGGASDAEAQPLLGELYYLQRALTPYTELSLGSIAELAQAATAVLVLADVGVIPEEDAGRAKAWIESGGVLLRFAGERLAENADNTLLPVRLRLGDRTLGGALSWTRPAALAPFASDSPFAGLEIPDDVTVKRQVLAEPEIDLGAKTWARLADGTPLVTAERRGRGWLVLVHTTANTDWSTLALSGLFVEMLRRIVDMSVGVAGGDKSASLPPYQTLDGFGRLGEPPPTASAAPAAVFASGTIGPKHPPGYYGSETSRRALNLSAGVREVEPLGDLPAGADIGEYRVERETDLKPWLLAAAGALLLIDLLIALALRGVLAPARRRAAAGLAVLACVASLGAGLGVGASPAPALAQDPDEAAIALTRDTHLAYVRTGSPTVDATSRAGLQGLILVLKQRSAVEAAAPAGVDLETDELAFYPLLYWPMTPEQKPLGPGALRRLDAYLRHGGIVFFDTRDQGALEGLGEAGEGTRALRAIVRGLDIPPLVPLPPDHVLTKSFYLLRQFPGRWDGGTIWLDSGDGRLNDGVASVLIGSNDYAGAWAVDDFGSALFPAVPGGEQQREMAYRFGVNLVMYALTGNYKSDQVHVPAILERLGQ
jgi:hypothetical protein